MRYDVIVVGAGPAGSTTAKECADRGLSVLLLDKAEFPRDKPCGGGVTPRATDLLDFDIAPVVERVAYGLRVTMRRSHEVELRSPTEVTVLTQRSRLDAFLVERAIEAGATLKQRVAIASIERQPSRVLVRTDTEVFEGASIVAADGANGTTARMAGLDTKLVNGIALEANITPQGDFPETWEDMVGLDLGGTPGGYGWVFPKGDHLNIGLGGWKYVGPSLRSRLDGLVRSYGFDPETMHGVRGYHLPMRSAGSPLVDGNLLLVGDAAGLLDPLTGEGIFGAIWSGQTAARHLAPYLGGEVADLDGYRLEVERELVPDLRVARQFHDLLHLTPSLYVGATRLTSLWGLICRILRGEQTYAQVMRAHPNLATLIDFVSDLIRVTPFLQRVAGLQDPLPPRRFFVRGAQH